MLARASVRPVRILPMTPSSRRFAAAAVALALATFFAAASARASGMRAGFSAPAAGSRVEAGASLRIAWDRPAARAGEREMELLLSLDGGLTFPVRLTRDLPIREGSLLWRVPALASRRARLALRAGDDEDPAAERIVCSTGEFTIGNDGGAPPARVEDLSRVRNEWRTTEALDGPRPVPLSSGLRSDSPESLSSAARGAELAGSRPVPVIAILRSSREPRVALQSPDRPAVAVAARPVSLATPLRL